MRTTFAARQFTNDVIPDETVFEILDSARFAPSGGNRQGWHVILVKDPEKRMKLGPLIEETMRRYRAQVRLGENPFNTITPTKVTDALAAKEQLPDGFVAQFTDAPVLLLILVDLKVVAAMDSGLKRIGVVPGASIYPFVWNILLAAREKGLGGTLTTSLTASEPQVKQIFDIPDHYAVAALLPIGKPIKQLTKLSRKPVAGFTSVDGFSGKSLE